MKENKHINKRKENAMSHDKRRARANAAAALRANNSSNKQKETKIITITEN